MKKEIISSKRLGEQYQEIQHPSGLTIMLYPMQGFSGAYALFATKYGSVDTCFKTAADKDFVCVPEGIAHFLEHKMFEGEDGVDAFTLYANTGATANAYTSFDRTAYLFSCTENFSESMEILLNHVTSPYFTDETVQKEQGIIGQEIMMYDDNAEWRVYFNLLQALYHENPVRINIAGTVESIAKIDAELLYRCYNTFYNLHNMVLAVAGNFEPEEVLAAADKILKKADPIEIERKTSDEPHEIRQSFVEEVMPVALPLFQMGFKGEASAPGESMRGQILDEVLLDIIAGDHTPLYRRLYDAGLINQTFSAESMSSRDYTLTLFGGESRDPKKVYDEILAEVARLCKEGLSDEAVSRSRKSVYGRYIGIYSSTDMVASLMVVTRFDGMGVYEPLDRVAEITKEQLETRLRQNFDPARSALSVIHA